MAQERQAFAILDPRTRWGGAAIAGLEAQPDGALALARVAAPDPGSSLDLSAPWDPPLAGLAASACEEIVLTAAGGVLHLEDVRCPDRHLVLGADPGCGDPSMASLAGLAARGRRLLVADPAGAAVHVLTLPGLERLATWRGFSAPTRVALDGAGLAYVLDPGAGRVVRLDPLGRVDHGYGGVDPALPGALDLAVALDGTALVSVDGDPSLLRFSPAGARLAPIAPPAEAPDLRPGALAAGEARLYAADRESGAVWVLDLAALRWLSPIPRLRAPVSAMAVDGAGNLFLRPGADLRWFRLAAAAAHLARGQLVAGPFDAGEFTAWMRVHAGAELPADTRLRLETALGPDPAAPPAASGWVALPSLDALVHPPGPPDVPVDPAARFLWLRASAESDRDDRTPSLRCIVAETPGDDWLAALPAVYARHDERGFLRRWLEALRAELGDRELEIGDLPRRLDPAVAPAGDLPWLASFLACDLPPRAGEGEVRALLLDAHRLDARRGTVAGLRELVRRYAGVDCAVVEDFRERRLWALGTARLGQDTGLLPALPDGMVVPGPSLPVPALQGLLAQYFVDDDLTTPDDPSGPGRDRCAAGPFEPIPPIVDPDGGLASLAARAAGAGGPPAFSVRWTGQVRARFSELYAFHLEHRGGARLFVDGEPVVDGWDDEVDLETRGSFPLGAGEWHQVRLEYWGRPGQARARLSWSSRSQPKEILPRECLYAVPAAVDPGARRADGGPEPLVVGETVVGAHGPLLADQLGAPLFEGAHRLTVLVRAEDVKAPGAVEAVRAVVQAEKPPWVEARLRVVEPRLRVGVQASVGVDALLGGPSPPGRLGTTRLGDTARLGMDPDHRDGTLRLDENLRIGAGTTLRQGRGR